MATPFTVEQANRTLPLVRRIVDDIVAHHRRWLDRVREFELLSAGSAAERVSPRAEEVQRDVLMLAGQIDGFVAELTELGIEFKDFALGLVDFPSEIEGREVYLCWKLGEPDVRFWHERDAGYSGRRPVELLSTKY
jgi:hypothetical protein